MSSIEIEQGYILKLDEKTDGGLKQIIGRRMTSHFATGTNKCSDRNLSPSLKAKREFGFRGTIQLDDKEVLSRNGAGFHSKTSLHEKIDEAWYVCVFHGGSFCGSRREVMALHS